MSKSSSSKFNVDGNVQFPPPNVAASTLSLRHSKDANAAMLGSAHAKGGPGYVPVHIGQVEGEGGGGGAGGGGGGGGGSMFAGVAGIIAIIVVFVMAGLFAWLYFNQENRVDSLTYRLIIAESLLVNHTNRLGGLDTLLATTIAKVTRNMMNIATLNATAANHETRILSLENRTTLLEGRMTDAELKLLGVMANVTTLQQEMIQAQLDILILYNDVLLLNTTIQDHEARIQALENKTMINMMNIQLLFQYLQGNLTIIENRLDTLNTTYTVSASGLAMLKSGVSPPADVRWETRHYTAIGGLDVEYLWISDTNWIPVMIRQEQPNFTYSFEISNFTVAQPYMAIPNATLMLDRPLDAYVQTKFMIMNEIESPVPYIFSALWNNTDVSLQFRSNLHEFSSVTIVKALTFITGFL